MACYICYIRYIVTIEKNVRTFCLTRLHLLPYTSAPFALQVRTCFLFVTFVTMGKFLLMISQLLFSLNICAFRHALHAN